MAIQMTIIGLNQVGVSLGLALQPYKDQIQRVGHDREPGAGPKAIKLGALDKSVLNLPASVENADIVVISQPLEELRRTLEVIAPVLKPGAVIMDTSANKMGVAGWVKELLPEDRYYVSLSPTLNPAYLHETNTGGENAHADLFREGLVVIASPVASHADALKLAADITALIGAKPYFADPYEVDGLLAASEVLPKLSAAALLQVTTAQASWREGRKLAARSFVHATEPINNPDEDLRLGQAAILNQENSLRALDSYIASLREIRQLIATGDADGLNDYLNTAQTSHRQWWQQRKKGDWDQIIEQPPMPSSGDMIGRLFGLRPRKPKDGDKNKK